MSVTISYPSTQFEELYGPFVNFGTHLPPKDNSPLFLSLVYMIFAFDFYFQFEINYHAGKCKKKVIIDM